MPMLYMDDAINATLQLMEAPSENLTVRSSYNLGRNEFYTKELAAEIKKKFQNLRFLTSQISDKLLRILVPASIDDSVAKKIRD